jgi:hypothetical protein
MLGPEKDMPVGEAPSTSVVLAFRRCGVVGVNFSLSCSSVVRASCNSLSQSSIRCVSLSHSSSAIREVEVSILTRREWLLVTDGVR